MARLLGRVSRHGWIFGLILAGLTGYWSYADAKPDLDENPIVVNKKISDIVNDAYRRNVPLVARGDPRGLWTVYNVFLDDRLLMQLGKLPDYETVRQTEHGKTFLVRYPSVYGNQEILPARIKKGCSVEIFAKAGLPIGVKPLHKLGEDCDTN